MGLKRNGLRSVRDFAYKVCVYVTKFDPLIRLAFPANPALWGALTAANQACALLVEEADKVIGIEQDA